MKPSICRLLQVLAAISMVIGAFVFAAGVVIEPGHTGPNWLIALLGLGAIVQGIFIWAFAEVINLLAQIAHNTGGAK